MTKKTDSTSDNAPDTTSKEVVDSTIGFEVNEAGNIDAAHSGSDAHDKDTRTRDSDLAPLQRKICVVTTAALPWRTGTAVNPLLRALYLTRGRPSKNITLLIPWLPDAESREKLYGTDASKITTQQQQEEWIRTYCRERCNCQGTYCNYNIHLLDGLDHSIQRTAAIG
jgi:hypothetical protein